ncbi:MAG TPA: YlmC/YmxH family sporulation protein [Epulopiscium sp.]|nr:YlmC/YmxH family sporulation protein [Candidatus Epulonipiscium sp.]
MLRIYDIKQKEVINVVDGSRLGYICDVEINWQEGSITKLIVPGPRKAFGLFGREMEYLIPWDKIKKIGADTILIEIDEEECLKESQ